MASWPIGTAIGTKRIIQAINEIKLMMEAMRKVKAVMDEYEAKQKTASRLQLNIMFVNVSERNRGILANMQAFLRLIFLQDQVNNLAKEIGPAMRTLEHLQGSWKNMVTDLETIQRLINNDTDKIPPMILARPQLQKIVDEWNDLRQFGMLRFY